MKQTSAFAPIVDKQTSDGYLIIGGFTMIVR